MHVSLDLYALMRRDREQVVVGLIFGFVSYLVFMGIQLAGEI